MRVDARARASVGLVVRAATSVVERLEQSPLPAPTPMQQLLLGAAAAQLRAATRTILVSDERHREGSAEASLGELVSRTLALVDDAMASKAEAALPPSSARELSEMAKGAAIARDARRLTSRG